MRFRLRGYENPLREGEAPADPALRMIGPFCVRLIRCGFGAAGASPCQFPQLDQGRGLPAARIGAYRSRGAGQDPLGCESAGGARL